MFAGSLPRAIDVKTAKESGAKVICFASTASMAKRLISWGTDALILEGNEAGGHVGHGRTLLTRMSSHTYTRSGGGQGQGSLGGMGSGSRGVGGHGGHGITSRMTL